MSHQGKRVLDLCHAWYITGTRHASYMREMRKEIVTEGKKKYLSFDNFQIIFFLFQNLV